MLKNLLRQECTILQEVQSGNDEWNDAVKTYTSVGTFMCRLDPNVSTELELDRDTRVTFQRLFLDETAAGLIDALSRVQMTDGKLYQVVGDPQTFYRRASVMHVEALVRVIEG